jgi:hypothetical protein
MNDEQTAAAAAAPAPNPPPGPGPAPQDAGPGGRQDNPHAPANTPVAGTNARIADPLAPERDDAGRLTREGIRRVIAQGGSTRLDLPAGLSVLITREEHIPPETVLAGGDPQLQARAMAGVKEQLARMAGDVAQIDPEFAARLKDVAGEAHAAAVQKAADERIHQAEAGRDQDRRRVAELEAEIARLKAPAPPAPTGTGSGAAPPPTPPPPPSPIPPPAGGGKGKDKG